MSNTSATGGYLLPLTGGSIDGLDLRRAIGAVLVGISGIDGTLVRPSWQQNPPPIPGIDVNWIAFFIQERRGDSNSYQQVQDSESSFLSRHEDLDILLSFYGVDCLQIAANVREGFELTQNNEIMLTNGLAFVRMGAITHIPELINDRYFDRADSVLTLRHEITKNYSILSFEKEQVTIINSK